MVVYEVNLQIHDTIWEDYISWLVEHIEGEQGMLSLPGFEKAIYCFPEHDDKVPYYRALTVCYWIYGMAHLQHYLKHKAPQVRAEGVARFGTLFSATRRIFRVEDHLHSDFRLT